MVPILTFDPAMLWEHSRQNKPKIFRSIKVTYLQKALDGVEIQAIVIRISPHKRKSGDRGVMR